ncbi:FtsX-like permease family protein [Actinomadura keratinilytica]|uniref:FtsX-like permease family protein n=1 Tax=Actinomadura keratinilytica TaxID=547461 RepID=UPI003613E9B4
MARPLNAVWAAARAGVRRRRLQTASIGVVVALSTATLLFGFGLLAASDSLFDDAFARARGAQATAAFDAAEAPPARVAATARAAGVTAAGPFRTAVLRQARVSAGMPGPGQDLLVAGRADPGGPVDRLTITSGRWVRGPGEIVLHGRPDGPLRVGGTLSSPGLPELTIVGFAISVTGTADGWVAPAQIGALRPDGLQMLYRFARAGDSPQVQRSLAEATAGLPVAGNTSYVTVRQAFQERFNQLIPFITVFGALAMAVSAVIIGTVVSGAVVAGFRHIGVLKALGFTPAQVTAVYVAMVMTPALAGCAAGVAAGHLLTDAMAGGIARGFELPSAGEPPSCWTRRRAAASSSWWRWPPWARRCGPGGCRRCRRSAPGRCPAAAAAGDRSGGWPAPGCRRRSRWGWACRSPGPPGPRSPWRRSASA